jgi:hypothetical protein
VAERENLHESGERAPLDREYIFASMGERVPFLPHVCGVDIRAGKEGSRMSRTDVGTRVGGRVRNGWSRGV